VAAVIIDCYEYLCVLLCEEQGNSKLLKCHLTGLALEGLPMLIRCTPIRCIPMIFAPMISTLVRYRPGVGREYPPNEKLESGA
jgi:hypothetical protein